MVLNKDILTIIVFILISLTVFLYFWANQNPYREMGNRLQINLLIVFMCFLSIFGLVKLWRTKWCGG